MTKEFNEIKNTYQRNLFAAASDKVDILSLYKQLPDINITGDYEEDLYHLAALFTDAKAILFLKEAGLRPNADKYGNTAFHALTTTRFDFSDPKLDQKAEEIYRTAQALLDVGVNPKKKNDSGKLAYFEAGLRYMYPFLQVMAEAGIRMDVTDSGGMNLLHSICDKLVHRKDIPGAVDAVIKTVRILIEKGGGIDIEDKDVYGTTPLTYAQRSGVKEVAALISGDESDIATGGMTIHEAVLNRDATAVEALIKAGTELNEVADQYSRTALMLACEYPSAPLVKLLAEGGADVNFRSGNDETAVYYLIVKSVSNLGRGMSREISDVVKILQILLANDLDVNAAVDKEGNTALNLLCQAGYLADLNNKLAEELIDAGADINQSNQSGKTPLMSFAERGNEIKYNITELLLDHDADVTCVDKSGNTALIYAAGNSDHMSGKRMVSLILDKDKSTLDRVNNAGQTALDIAVQQNNEATVKQLMI